MPFLFQLIYRKLAIQANSNTDTNQREDDSDDGEDPIPAAHVETDAIGDDLNDVLPFDCNQRAYMVAKTICSMVAFVKNRRNNGHQLANSLTFLACGVTNRVNLFLNYVGLSSSRKTAHHALNKLSRRSSLRISTKIGKLLAPTLGSFLCFDNLDFEQRVHTKSVGHSSRMFHGTWGYVHHPSPKLVSSVSSSDLTIESYHQAMLNVESVDVHSRMLLPTAKEEVQWELVLKSQITSALLEHLAIPAESYVSINTKPPVVDQISSERPDITMLKLMIAADNSAQGAGEVFQAIVNQSNLTMSDFASRIQLIDGDLATCSNLTTLRTQRTPSKHKEESLMNVLTMLGGAHTLWNISQAIYSKHVGDKSDSRDAGAWRFLDGLGIPSNNMLDKKDFTLMIRNIEKIQRATLVYCLMLVMGIQDKHLTKELPKISSLRIKQIVDETYERFFSIEAKRNATIHTSPKLSNLLLRLSDFATVVEGNSAMKSGDIGRLMNVWKRCS
ncbi:uncharacterized protein PGTG_22657 [Puccinia graminis f. sp. tritici CRL 75-36-700-3]|uniref:DUF6589 domain-containing protein n=1 Tax=Puccinia graminis f. sp. tritici (strain CRL 75-36-700-3 / race SCCL) TaxID=418459 RepID=H6QV68_PUCGT|nr:uncharacterized protein PGTG_22657 [Puccinia graminis f. sp. tritici CRL 75-36-700-3]EHS62729.1 hypothetical protein PGTG_22657 [Puccinia graminis f. sp. tritici CRL 75-36-700-3]